MGVFQCNGCPSGPCILTNMDPEFDAQTTIKCEIVTCDWQELVPE